jgi:hypothetical protein
MVTRGKENHYIIDSPSATYWFVNGGFPILAAILEARKETDATEDHLSQLTTGRYVSLRERAS